MIVLHDGTEHEFGKDFTPSIETIAFALSNINRFTGHVGQYSVAQHCVMIAEKLPTEHKLSGLLHDAPEAYLGDVSAPLKRLLPHYRDIEQYYHSVIDQCFNVETQHPAVKEFDLSMLVAEAARFGLPLEHFPKKAPLYTNQFSTWPAWMAEKRFLAMYQKLTGNPVKQRVKESTITFSMNGFRRNLHCELKELKEHVISALNDEYVDKEDLEDSMNQVICSANGLNCVWDPDNENFTNMEDLYLPLIDEEEFHQ